MAKPHRGRSYTKNQRAEALELAEQVGSGEASRRLGVPEATIRGWRHRAGKSGAPKGQDPAEWAKKRRKTANDTAAVAAKAPAETKRLLDQGKTREAKECITVHAIALDKSIVAEQQAERAAAQAARLNEQQAELILEVLRYTFEGVGITFSEPIRRHAGDLLQKARNGEPLSPYGEHAEEAKAQVRREIGSELSVQARAAELRRRPRWWEPDPSSAAA
jgi:transposase